MLTSVIAAFAHAAAKPKAKDKAKDMPPKPLRALIVDGQNNHDWQRTTESLRLTLAATGRFTVTISTTPPKGAPPAAWQAWRPDLGAFDVVVSN